MGLNLNLKALVPKKLRQLLRKTHRHYVFDRAMQSFIKSPRLSISDNNQILNALIYGWGNEAWSALDEYLKACISHAYDSKGAVLECGSGLSTLLVGVVAQHQGQQHWVLEHTPQWAVKVEAALKKYQIKSVKICVNKLKDYVEYDWYETTPDMLEQSFDLVLCDGPPGTTKGGRYGLVPQMKLQLNPNAVILLDDAGREDELKIANRWKTELGASLQLLGTKKPYMKIVLSGS